MVSDDTIFSAGSPKNSAAGERIREFGHCTELSKCMQEKLFFDCKTATVGGNTSLRLGVAAVSNFAAWLSQSEAWLSQVRRG
jgi:hypothetical protein